ncbi:MAG: hypothetical protein WCB23_07485, partial [Pseudolabrys sp.]
LLRRIQARPDGQERIQKPAERPSIRIRTSPNRASRPTPRRARGVTVHDESEAKDQPAVATGQDLKGPARQFPPSKNQNSQRFKPE